MRESSDRSSGRSELGGLKSSGRSELEGVNGSGRSELGGVEDVHSIEGADAIPSAWGASSGHSKASSAWGGKQRTQRGIRVEGEGRRVDGAPRWRCALLAGRPVGGALSWRGALLAWRAAEEHNLGTNQV